MELLRLGTLFLAAGLVHADVTFTGWLDPALNPNLTSWDQYAAPSGVFVAPLSTALDPWGVPEAARNIAVHSFSLTSAGPVTFASLGYGLGGFDAVLSLFEGSGNPAAYVVHAYNPFAAGDFNFTRDLEPGLYTLAISMFANEPCAPGLCTDATGTFGDGFTNLVNFDPFQEDPLFYRVEVIEPVSAVPEPSSLLLLAGAAGLALSRSLVGRAFTRR